MECKVEKTQNANEVKLEITIEAEKFENAMKKVYFQNAKYFNIPGFRKGKAPKEMLRSKIKVEDVFNEAVNYFLNDNYAKVLTDNNLKPIVQPRVDVKKVTMEEVECDIIVVGEPKVELKEYKGLKIEKTTVAVTESEVEEEIKRLLEEHDNFTDSKLIKESIYYLKDKYPNDFLQSQLRQYLPSS